jgi:hypothetical protein
MPKNDVFQAGNAQAGIGCAVRATDLGASRAGYK